ncbi:hypothetical protein KOW79_018034 [Hemibagrus wyckioides]|uniref:Uncharacterized protein n=1 Tax=Hemibagrus wyckioides TaxID=337641 RepID=A0A9D3N9B8_9TELE|nr:hypothetical protein KOW79_018034 [Hemibagrus wyckioides]
MGSVILATTERNKRDRYIHQKRYAEQGSDNNTAPQIPVTQASDEEPQPLMFSHWAHCRHLKWKQMLDYRGVGDLS